MALKRRKLVLVLVGLSILFVSVGAYTLLIWTVGPKPSCPSIIGRGENQEAQLSPTSFDAVTNFPLPSPSREPNGIIAVSDGSVWFGEQAVPGLGHLFPNGTLHEFAFPGDYFPSANSGFTCSHRTGIGGVAFWQGKVWATDSAGNEVIGFDPSKRSFQVLRLPQSDSQPYAITTGGDGSLWVTELRTFSILKIDTVGGFHQFRLPEYVVPTEVIVINRTLGYFTDPGIAGFGSLYTFNPDVFSYKRVGGAVILFGPDSVSQEIGGRIWVAEHGGSSVAVYDPSSSEWTEYPTSNVGFSDLTLPFSVRANGSSIWFDEQFGNRVGVINQSAGTLSEYSISKPPASNFTSIGDVRTIALSNDSLWFTESAGNLVGFIDPSYTPGFSLSLSEGSRSLSLARGTAQDLTLKITGQWPQRIRLEFSDTEARIERLQNIILQPDAFSIGLVNSSQKVTLTVGAGANLQPGRYMLAITATDGLVYESVYIEISVLQ